MNYSIWRTSNINGMPLEANYHFFMDINTAHQRMEEFYQEDKVNSLSSKWTNKSTYEVREVK